eukprot:CAMPEP_0179860848 /NCGR_PEP_ID=MMETSP0982-20121206/13885_1 /TAXON_ID=483367 /ORGANISM="non described non described, Strain CCMP 2436" /LENGTH=109 /DNA_ID=CAMNT_0021748227 /DNA_START=21 /DNA_END=346 /DNA_ORIENTATION=-
MPQARAAKEAACERAIAADVAGWGLAVALEAAAVEKSAQQQQQISQLRAQLAEANEAAVRGQASAHEAAAVEADAASRRAEQQEQQAAAVETRAAAAAAQGKAELADAR